MNNDIETGLDIIAMLDKTSLTGVIVEGVKLHSRLKEDRLKKF